jgi:O-antigen ligase
MLSLERVERLLLVLLVLFIPVSASPLLPFGSGTLVRPLAIVPAMLLLVCICVRVFLLKQSMPYANDGINLLLLFICYVVLSGLVIISVEPDDLFKGQTPLDSFLRALLTLLAGIAFYVVGRCYIRSAEDIKLTLRFLWIAFSSSVFLALVQVVAIVEGGNTLRIVQAITDVFSVHYDGLTSRAQGMTFEPSWLATQIIVVLVPTLVAQSISRQSFVASNADHWVLPRAAGGFAVVLTGLLCAGSRFGFAAAAALIGLSSLVAVWRGRFAAAMGLLLFIAAGIAGVVAMGNLQSGAGATYVLGPLDVLTNSGGPPATTNSEQRSEAVAETLAVVGRVAAAQSAVNIWLANPLTGVSFGNDFRYFPAYAPDWAFATALFQQNAKEGLGWIDAYAPEKGNAKDLVLRLLAETGITGFVLFALFFVRQTFSVRATDAYFAYFRISTVGALVFSTFNGDSFADPILWIPLVLCSAMGRLQAPAPETECDARRDWPKDAVPEPS